MGDPKKTKKHYESPRKPWDKARLEEEKLLKETYGLKNKRELWRVETILRQKRKNARALLAMPLEERTERTQLLIRSLARYGLLDEKAGLDDILTLSVESLLERRLQTLVWRNGIANTVMQARQFIVHGHIGVNGRRLNAPSYLVPVSEEKGIGYYGKEMQLKPKVAEKKKPVAEKAEAKGEGKAVEKPVEEAKEEKKEAEKPVEEKAPKEAQAEEIKKGEKKAEKTAEPGQEKKEQVAEVKGHE